VCVCASFGVVSLVGGVYCTKSKFSSQIIRAAANARGNWKKAAFVLLQGNKWSGGVGGVIAWLWHLRAFSGLTDWSGNLIDLLICLKVASVFLNFPRTH